MKSSVLCLAIAMAAAGCARTPAAPSVQVVDVAAGDFFFQALDTIAAGRTEFRMRNAGGHHVMVVIRIDSGHTLADMVQVPDSVDEPGWIVNLGGPVTGDSNGVERATLDLVPGHYVLLCYFHDGAVPHYAKGMVRELAVIGPAGPAATPPEADIVVNVTDYDFVLSQPLTAGRHTLRFVNASPQGHEIISQRLTPGKHLADWRQARQRNTPRPATYAGGVGGLGVGQTIMMTTDIVPGDYVWYCMFTDATDERSHLDHGMVREIHVD